MENPSALFYLYKSNRKPAQNGTGRLRRFLLHGVCGEMQEKHEYRFYSTKTPDPAVASPGKRDIFEDLIFCSPRR
jgi:hypothetical protein